MRPKNVAITVLLLPIIIIGILIVFDTFINKIEYTLKPVVILTGQSIEPADFFESAGNLIDNDIVIEFSSDIVSYPPGRHDVDIKMSRRLRNQSITAELYVLEPVTFVNVELGLPGRVLSPYEFIVNAEIAEGLFTVNFVSDVSGLELLPVGNEPVFLILNGITTFSSLINVADRTPPDAVIQNISVPLGEDIDVDDFIVEIVDASEIMLTDFIVKPNKFSVGNQDVEIVIVDVFGNHAFFQAVLTVLPPETPPVFEGLRDITAMIDTGILYRQGVTAIDALGREIPFEFDNSRVNFNERGVYTVIYSATDEWGLRTEKEIKVTITNIDTEEVDRRVDDILKEILRDGMTQVQQARVIFDWIVKNVEFAGGIGQDNVYEAAHQALQFRRGHCFVFYGISEVMLTRAGIPNMRIERIPGTPSRHRWNLINPDGLGWHHFDSNQSFVGSERFMFTSRTARMLTAAIAENPPHIIEYYTYDPSLYPPIQ